MDVLPQRPTSHVVGDQAVRFFIASCPSEWAISQIAPDYGLDLRVELVRDGRVTGNEFAVQVKGKNRLQPSSAGVVVAVKQSTVNYWLGKMCPVMIVAASIMHSRLWFGWLEHIYSDYPTQVQSDRDVDLRLRTEISNNFGPMVELYISEYFSRIRTEILALPDRTQLSRFSLHVAALARTLTQVHLTLTSGLPSEQLQDQMHWLFLEYGIHDSFLLSLWEPDSPWRRALSSHIAEVVGSKISEYIRLRSQFWMRQQSVDAGDFKLVPFSYKGLTEYLLPTLASAWELQDVLNQLLVLGSTTESRGDRGSG